MNTVYWWISLSWFSVLLSENDYIKFLYKKFLKTFDQVSGIDKNQDINPNEYNHKQIEQLIWYYDNSDHLETF